ncbi:TPA: acetate--CoA ligase [Candidatus Woesearchaeota archaeon]|nr:acetate--CoA ligase [Candidatus Woesearchaeota archaeon]
MSDQNNVTEKSIQHTFAQHTSTQHTITSTLDENRKFSASKEFSANAHIKSLEEYKKLYDYSVKNPEQFWKEQSALIHWFKPFDKVLEWNKPFCKWFLGGKTNVAYNCLDRHLATARKNKAAILWEGDNGETKTYTYQQLHREVCRFANVLKQKGVTKGDRVCIYMPMVPELAIAMLACARIGAVHSIVFGGFSVHSLRDRINDCEAKLVVTTDAGIRGGKIVPLKENIDKSLEECLSVQSVIVSRRANAASGSNSLSGSVTVHMKEGRDFWWDDEMAQENLSSVCDAVEMDSEDPLFILYTSGTTGKPKGILHTTAGYLLYTTLTFKHIFDYHEEDTFWCTADIGWVTGHSYIVYGPLSNGATTLMFEGTPFYPDPARFWQVVEKYKVNIFYTAPTAIRALAKEGIEWTNKYDLSSLRLLGTVGEPINPEAWMWYYDNVGKKKCPIVDTWWQTETGGILISPIPGAIVQKPGSATLPFFGVQPVVLKEDGTEAAVNEGGYLTIKYPWPSMMRTIYGDPERFKETYFSKFANIAKTLPASPLANISAGLYFTGDGARKDEDGYFWLMGRIDDVINIAGHRLGTAEIESALVSHKSVAEAAVVPRPHEVKGQAIYAYVTLKQGVEKTHLLKDELIKHVASEISPIAKPEVIHFADNLPKTRSGKIMRRILKAIAEGKEDVGDTTTLADPSVVAQLLQTREI